MALASAEVKRNRKAALYLLTSVVGISVLPLAMVVVGAPDSPLLFGAFLSVGTSLGALAFLVARYGSLLRDRRIRTLIRENLVSWPIFFLLLGTFEFTFFAWGTRFVDAAVATILWGSWPIIFVFLLSRIFRGSREQPARYRKVSPSLILLMAFSLVGLAYVVLAQAGKQSGFDWTSDSSWLGFAFALLSGILITFNIFSFSWSTKLARKARIVGVGGERRTMELFFITVIVCISNAFTAPFKAGFSVLAAEQIQPDVILAGLIVGGTLRVGSSLLWRHANLITHALGINALGYAEPLFGVLWLALFWEVNIPRVDFLVIGTCAIIASNLLINSEVDIPLSFKATILSLWSTGTLVYFREGGWQWDVGRYWTTLAGLSAIFAVLLGVRMNRPPLVLLGRHARDDRQNLVTRRGRAGSMSVATGWNMMQMLTLGAYGGGAVLLAALVRPPLVGWAGWLTDMMAVLFCAAIVGLVYRTTGRPRLATSSTVAATLVESDRPPLDPKEHRVALWTFMVVATGTFLCYFYLLWDKWLNGGG